MTYITKTTSSFRGRAGQQNIQSPQQTRCDSRSRNAGPKNSKSIYYSKTTLIIISRPGGDECQRTLYARTDGNGKRYEVYEDLLFLHEKGRWH